MGPSDCSCLLQADATILGCALDPLGGLRPRQGGRGKEQRICCLGAWAGLSGWLWLPVYTCVAAGWAAGGQWRTESGFWEVKAKCRYPAKLPVLGPSHRICMWPLREEPEVMPPAAELRDPDFGSSHYKQVPTVLSSSTHWILSCHLGSWSSRWQCHLI